MIEFLDATGEWKELYGHACQTEDEARQYVSMLGSDGRMRLKGEEAPFPLKETEAPVLLSVDSSPEHRSAVQKYLNDILKDLK